MLKLNSQVIVKLARQEARLDTNSCTGNQLTNEDTPSDKTAVETLRYSMFVSIASPLHSAIALT